MWRWRFQAFSRNVNVTRNRGCVYLKIADQYDLRAQMIKLAKSGYGPFAVQGEIIGSKIQGNKYGLDGHRFHLFSVLTPQGRESFSGCVLTAGRLVVPMVPVLAIPTGEFIGITVDEIVKTASRRSTLANIPMEGIVVRSTDQTISFKVINPEFLIKYEC